MRPYIIKVSTEADTSHVPSLLCFFPSLALNTNIKYFTYLSQLRLSLNYKFHEGREL